MIASWVPSTFHHSSLGLRIFLALIGNVGLLVVYAVPDIVFVLQDFLYLSNRPGVPLAFGLALVDVDKGAVSLEVQP